MTKIAFEGFMVGSTVTIAGVTVPAWKTPVASDVWSVAPTLGVSASVIVRRSDHQVAPEAAYFELSLSGFHTNTETNIQNYDASYHDKTVFWNFGEGYTYAAPAKVLEMDAADSGDRANSRYGMGPMGAHVFRQPGTYTVRAAIYEPPSATHANGAWAQATFSITVADPVGFYGTLFVDTNGAGGGYPNSPSGATNYSSLAAAWSAMERATTPTRIILERGQTHLVGTTLRYRPPSNATATALRIEAAEGAGARPVLQTTASFPSGTTGVILDQSRRNASGVESGAIIKGIEIAGTWDTTTQTGNWFPFGIYFDPDSAGSCVVDDCVIRGVNTGIRTDGPLGQTALTDTLYMVNDTRITDWSNYGIFDPDRGYIAALGCEVAQNVDAQIGGPKDNAHNNHGPWRQAAPNRTIIHSCDFFSSTGWSAISGTRAVQPAMRWATGLNFPGARLNMQQSAMEGGFITLFLQTANDRSLSRRVNAVIERNAVVAGFQSNSVVTLTHGGITFALNYMIYPDTQYNSNSIGGQSRGPGTFIGTPTNGDGNLTDAANLAAPLRIFNNTFINAAGSAATIFRDRDMGFTSVEQSNNVLHEPNRSSPNTPYAPFTSVIGFIPRYRGYRDESGTLFTQFASPADAVTLLTPAPGSSALAASTASGPVAPTRFATDRTTSGIVPAAVRNIGAN